jgi:hypothetical protein
MSVPKRETYSLVSDLRSAHFKLSDHEFATLEDRRFINEVLKRDIAEAILTAEYLDSIAE